MVSGLLWLLRARGTVEFGPGAPDHNDRCLAWEEQRLAELEERLGELLADDQIKGEPRSPTVGITAVMDLVTNRADETMESLRRGAPRPQRPPTPEAVKIRDAEWLADPGAEGQVVPYSTKLSDGFAQDSWP